MTDLHAIIRYPLLTERTTEMRAQNKYAMVVAPQANKIEIKKAAEQLFETKVEKVNIANYQGKIKRVGARPGRRSNWKKAIITLTAGESIKIFEN